ncbi:MFS transporter [Rhodanobacter denitrificans]|uniref:Major Facilitator Superfamily transporter n=1 Tax=Rhodanobacter denitrificans TaxID=666685 RepID=M4NGV1_9GAMM|nr:MFS transporter [Rhodanobacter denitrificans]AGG90175.1 Major Facilitator Superfamily transporter [Rhodanobacter denitrificans]UJM85563.1 MFS transporter [Rhodanobacter denitrificans]
MKDGRVSRAKPELSFWQIWHMCFGFLGIQFGFALQNANVSRIFQTLGANVDQIPVLWIAAPLTGLIVQPVIGYFSDRTWNRFGRRRPYFFAGAVLATLALLAMPNSPTLWIAAGLLWIMDASFNVSMEPFRAFVGDQLPPRQRPLGYAMQSVFIGVGAVVASFLPYLLTHFGVANTAPPGEVPHSVKYAFYAGAFVLLGAMLWTILGTREYPPEQLVAFSDNRIEEAPGSVAGAWKIGALFLLLGLVLLGLIGKFALEKELYLLAGGLAVFGALFVWLSQTRSDGALRHIMGDLHGMPLPMRRLNWVQFFSWFAMFAMWINTTPAVAGHFYGSTDTTSVAYNEGANWAGVLMGTYNGVGVLAAIAIPLLARACGLRWSHLINLWLGGLGLLSFLVIRDPHWLIVSMVGVGFAWASILSLPYAMLSDNLPAAKMGVYMGIFNFFIVIPQLLAASVLGVLLKLFFHNQPIWALGLGGASLLVAGLCTLRVAEPTAPSSP